MAESEFYVCKRYNGGQLPTHYVVGNCCNCNHQILVNEVTRGGAPGEAEPLCMNCFTTIDSDGDEWAITEAAVAEVRAKNPKFSRLAAIAHLRRQRDEFGKRLS